MTIHVNDSNRVSIMKENQTARAILIFSTFLAWIKLLFELHNFSFSLSVFVVATINVFKRLISFGITTLIFVAMFAHMFYIAGPDDPEICTIGNAMYANYTDEELNSEGKFACSRWGSYDHSAKNMMNYETIPGVLGMISATYAFIMVILFLNIVIAVIGSAFDEVRNESEKSFWSDRLVIVHELIFADKLKIWFIEKTDFDLTKERCNLNHCLEFINQPSLIARLLFFFKRSKLDDIYIPGDVFEQVLFGSKRTRNCLNRICALPLKVALMITCVIFIVPAFWLGILWPRKLKWSLFYVDMEKQSQSDDTDNGEDIIPAMCDKFHDISIHIKKESDDNMEQIKFVKEDIKKVQEDVEKVNEAVTGEVNGVKKELRIVTDEVKNEMKVMKKDITRIEDGIKDIKEIMVLMTKEK